MPDKIPLTLGIPLTVRDYFRVRGLREPGESCYGVWIHKNTKCPYWDNCDGRHVLVVCPDDEIIDLSCRASNCDRLEDRTHRCWCIHGTLPDITVDKDGDSCGSGAGSIQTGGWHGFIRHGRLLET